MDLYNLHVLWFIVLDIYYQDYLNNGFGNPYYVQTLNHHLVVASNLRINWNQDYVKNGFFKVNHPFDCSYLKLPISLWRFHYFGSNGTLPFPWVYVVYTLNVVIRIFILISFELRGVTLWHSHKVQTIQLRRFINPSRLPWSLWYRN